jgi:hypothetical protein
MFPCFGYLADALVKRLLAVYDQFRPGRSHLLHWQLAQNLLAKLFAVPL